MKIVGRTDVGSRENNEDRYYIDPKKRYFMVADGMGGHAAGEIASEMAITILSKELDQKPISNERQLLNAMNDGIQMANLEIFQLSSQKLKYRGMGTTLSFVYILGDYLYFANVGDSRIYVLDDHLRQLSTDDSFVNYLVQIGDITAEEAKAHPKKNILTKALGTTNGIEFQIRSLPLEDIKGVFLCSDGITDALSDERIQEIILGEETVEQRADALIAAALKEGARDNITILLWDVNG
ncbi:MAG: Stp1/IreP family PP2C-type Ser/Thr phosphatase [Tissierellia bacterium]|nr:Stp1/IreP family PP2C-type Ser/Thr phosphatase [Tissierellia bacterium]